ncbi:hypothetical protein V2J09_019961 [Rumex salicifolius]
MKFGKDFKKQMVPEWIEAYMDYNGLKGILHEIRNSQGPKKPLTRLKSLQRSFSRLSTESFDQLSHGDIENQAIDVKSLPGESNMTVYKTNLLMPPEEAGEEEVNFFRKLDDELNKGVLTEASKLNKQMDALIALRIKLRNQDPLEILDRVDINATAERPLSAIKKLLKDSKDRDVNFSKEELKAVEDRMKLVFTEFYQKLRQLKQYSFMNLSAFSKIMKTRSYMHIVNALLVKVEDLFSQHFFSANRREAMKLLRHKSKREKHRVTFFSGFFTGCAIALLIAIVLLICIFSLAHANVRYKRIFLAALPNQLSQGTELGFREVFLLSAGLAVFALGFLLVNFYMIVESSAAHHQNRRVLLLAKLIPLILLVVVLLIFLCPFHIIYRSSRIFLVKHIFRCVCAPFYEVTLPDFFLADHLTSQVQAIRSLAFYVCYYSCKDVSQSQSKCNDYPLYNIFYFIIALIPYWIRCLQCLRRLVEERETVNIYNALKYFLTVIAVVLRSVYERRDSKSWLILSLISSAIAVIYQTYWDVVVDWGLLRWRSKNFLLRDKLMVSHKSVYFTAMAVDILLRISWLQLVLEFKVRTLQKTAISTMISLLEIVRRGIWSFFRLENEHVNNVGKYRAFRSVPLPFNYHDENHEEKGD